MKILFTENEIPERRSSDIVFKMINFALNMMSFLLKMMKSVLKNLEICIALQPLLGSGRFSR